MLFRMNRKLKSDMVFVDDDHSSPVGAASLLHDLFMTARSYSSYLAFIHCSRRHHYRIYRLVVLRTNNQGMRVSSVIIPLLMRLQVVIIIREGSMGDPVYHLRHVIHVRAP